VKTAALALLLLTAVSASAADYATVAVQTTATRVTASLTVGVSYRSILIENGGANDVFCSRDASVTASTGHKVGANDGWRAFPVDGPIYCITTVSQTGAGRDLTIIWGSTK
jgi:hypothetical protein